MSGWLESLHTGEWSYEPEPFNGKFGSRTIPIATWQKAGIYRSLGLRNPPAQRNTLAKYTAGKRTRAYLGRHCLSLSPYVRLGTRLYPTRTWSTLPIHATESVTAIDRYTVAFKWNVPNAEVIRDAMQSIGSFIIDEAHEAVEKWGNLDDWHHAIGTGPFILKDFIPGDSATLVGIPITGDMTNQIRRISSPTSTLSRLL